MGGLGGENVNDKGAGSQIQSEIIHCTMQSAGPKLHRKGSGVGGGGRGGVNEEGRR